MRLAPLLAALALAVVPAACSKKPEPAPQSPPPPEARGSAFTLKDLAAATAVDARLARLSLVAGDVHQALAALAPGSDARPVAAGRARAKELVPALDEALAAAEAALAGVGHPVDQPTARRAVAAARSYAAKLSAAVASPDPAPKADLFAARDALGGAISAYRASRVAWRLDAPEPAGVEREFAEARREMERIESELGERTRVAPRESGHELDPSAARMTGQMAARRAKAAAAQLAPGLRDAAGRYADAEARALDAFAGLFQAPVAERQALSRAYHAAKVDALDALADYFAALSAR